MPREFSLKWMLVAVAFVAGLFAAIAANNLQGLVIYASVVLGFVIFLAPARVDFSARLLIVLMSIGAALVGWCVLRGSFGSQTMGSGWYRGQLDEIGGWSVGIFVGAWRASLLFSRAKEQPTEDA